MTVFSIVVIRLLDALVPIYLKNFINVLSLGGDKNLLIPQLFRILIIIAVISFSNWVLWRVATFLASVLESRVIFDLSNYCFNYLHRHSFAFFNNNFIGSLVKRVNRFTRSYETMTDRFVFNFLQLFVEVGVIAVILFFTNRWLGVAMLGWAVFFCSVSLIFVRYKLKYDLERSEADTKATGFLADTFTNNANVKLFNGYQREVNGMSKLNDNVRRLRLFTWNLNNIFEATQGALSVCLEIGMLYLGIKLWQKGLVTIGDFVLIQSYIFALFNRFWNFGKIIRRFYEGLGDAEEMTEVLNTPHEIVDKKGAKGLNVKNSEIEFVNAKFNYNETRNILSDLSFKIKSKEKVALVGPSGAGKSTIVKLLLRMHDITSGSVLIDGQKISDVTQDSLWKNISLVPQEPILFHRSLMENIRYGKPEATDEEVINAAKLANCHNFIVGLSEGYNTFVGERGIKLSGGERQRVAIARAILRNAPILVLDEATSSLDSESEMYIQDALDKLMKDKTVIVIAHRLSTIMRMDRIIVIDEGKIIEDGKHRELIEKEGGLYKRLWEVQAGGFVG